MSTNVRVLTFLVLAAFLTACGSTPANVPPAAPPTEITPAHRAALEYLARHEVLSKVELRKTGERNPSAVYGTTVRFEQLHHGVPVLNTFVVCEVTASGVRVVEKTLRDVDIDVTPRITSKAAARAAMRAARFKAHTTRQLVIVPTGAIASVRSDTLAWWVIIENGFETWDAYVDATSGAVLQAGKIFPRE